ncbi:MAG: hypothetical protein GEV05_23925 [Betaproteobacteria bacterium]|nr:hypothetical protein [Betaproteobacteria bacterium]
MAPISTRSGARLSRPVLVLMLVLVLAFPAAPAAAADPLLMFMLGFAKNLIESAIEANAAKPAPAAIVVAPAPLPKAPAHMDAADLRALVDESFGYLSSAQRAELLAGLDKALSDPANAPYRDAILAQFVGVARQVSFAHQQLERLSPEDKQALAQRFARNYRTLAPEYQQALSQQLRARALPLPADLNDMMLSALASAQ